MQHVRVHHRPPRGFTLVEMLVVITIIGVLVALLVPTVNSVMKKARVAAMAVEINGLAQAAEAYKAKNNDYFPDFTNIPAVVAHVQKAWPRNTRNVTAWVHANETVDAAEALVFWLTQTRDNVRDPLAGSGEKVVYFAFDETRLADKDNDGFQEYYPKNAPDAPYVYFDGRVISVANPAAAGTTIQTYAYAWALYPSPYNSSTPRPDVPLRTSPGIPRPTAGVLGIIRPFRTNITVPGTEQTTWQDTAPAARTKWVEPGRFQIVCGGMDNHFGPDESTLFKSYPTPIASYTGTADEDNLTSFSEGKTLEEAVP